MNYYPFHVGDYTAHTAHLEPMEDLAYRRMLDLYYLRESALPTDVDDVCALVGAKTNEQSAAVQSILIEFFKQTDSGWSHSRCEREIAIYRAKKARHWAATLTKPQRAEMAGERRAAKISATPDWLTQEDRNAIASVYERAATLTAQTGEKHEVDHVVPLRSKAVCGLHVPWNLRVMLAYKNRAKSNSFEVV
mgnify:CR=1 FL=1